MQKEVQGTWSAFIPQVRLLLLRKIENGIDLLDLPGIPAQHCNNSLYPVLAGRRAEDSLDRFGTGFSLA